VLPHHGYSFGFADDAATIDVTLKEPVVKSVVVADKTPLDLAYDFPAFGVSVAESLGEPFECTFAEPINVLALGFAYDIDAERLTICFTDEFPDQTDRAADFVSFGLPDNIQTLDIAVRLTERISFPAQPDLVPDATDRQSDELSQRSTDNVIAVDITDDVLALHGTVGCAKCISDYIDAFYLAVQGTLERSELVPVNCSQRFADDLFAFNIANNVVPVRVALHFPHGLVSDRVPDGFSTIRVPECFAQCISDHLFALCLTDCVLTNLVAFRGTVSIAVSGAKHVAALSVPDDVEA